METDPHNSAAPEGEGNGRVDESKGQEKGRMLLILNGKQAVKWSALDAKVCRLGFLHVLRAI